MQYVNQPVAYHPQQAVQMPPQEGGSMSRFDSQPLLIGGHHMQMGGGGQHPMQMQMGGIPMQWPGGGCIMRCWWHMQAQAMDTPQLVLPQLKPMFFKKIEL